MSSGFLGFSGSSFVRKSRLLDVGLRLLLNSLLDIFLSTSLSLSNTHGLVENLLKLRVVVSRVGVDVMGLQVVLQVQSLSVSISVGVESWLAEERGH